MPPRRKRRRPNWGPILGLLIVANVAAGLMYSPLTEVRRIRIVGAPLWDRGRLVQAAQTLKDVPALSLNPREFETKLLAHRALLNADFRRSLFGSATLRLEYRQPVARVEGTPRLCLGREGTLFSQPNAEPGLPVLRLHPSALRPSFTLAGAWPSRQIAELIGQIPAPLREKLVIEVDSEGAICFNTGVGARIRLGSAERLLEKLRTLEGLLEDEPDLLRNVIELNLTEPTRPAWKARPGAKS